MVGVTKYAVFRNKCFLRQNPINNEVQAVTEFVVYPSVCPLAPCGRVTGTLVEWQSLKQWLLFIWGSGGRRYKIRRIL